MSVKKNLNKIMEVTWLLIAIFSLVTFAVVFYNHGWKPAQPMAIFFPIAVIFYFVRRKRSKALSEEE